MRLRLSLLRDAAGLLVVATVVVLHWPGIRVARADTPAPEARQFERFQHFVREQSAPPSASPDASCSAGAAPLRHQQQLRAMMALARRAAAQAAAAGQPADDEVVVLNGRGYNYGPDPGPAAPWPR